MIGVTLSGAARQYSNSKNDLQERIGSRCFFKDYSVVDDFPGITKTGGYFQNGKNHYIVD